MITPKLALHRWSGWECARPLHLDPRQSLSRCMPHNRPRRLTLYYKGRVNDQAPKPAQEAMQCLARQVGVAVDVQVNLHIA